MATPTTVPPAPTGNRIDWVQQRAMALLGNRHVPTSDEDEDRGDSRLKRGLRKLFPGFR
jgi:hypothetical protein